MDCGCWLLVRLGLSWGVFGHYHETVGYLWCDSMDFLVGIYLMSYESYSCTNFDKYLDRLYIMHLNSFGNWIIGPLDHAMLLCCAH